MLKTDAFVFRTIWHFQRTSGITYHSYVIRAPFRDLFPFMNLGLIVSSIEFQKQWHGKFSATKTAY